MGGGDCFLSLRLIALLIRYPISEHLPLRHRIANSNVNHNSLRFIIILCLKRRYVYVNLLVSRKGKEKNIFTNCGHSFPQIPRLKSRNRYHEVMVNFWETKKKIKFASERCDIRCKSIQTLPELLPILPSSTPLPMIGTVILINVRNLLFRAIDSCQQEKKSQRNKRQTSQSKPYAGIYD